MGGGGPSNPGPSDGSSLLALVDSDGTIRIVADGVINAAGLDMRSEGGHLVPVPDSVGAAPFTFFLANTSNQITWGNLGTIVTFDGEWVSGARYTGPDPENDLMLAWGFGAVPVSFPAAFSGAVDAVDPTDPVVPEPSSSLLLICGLLGITLGRRRS